MTPDLNSLLQQAQQLKEVKALVTKGKMIEAIKLYREITDVGLKEAKDAVEKIARGEPVQITSMQIETSGDSPQPQIEEVQRLIQAGHKIEAIKIYRQLTGLGLKEAKEAVEAMERGEDLSLVNMQISQVASLGDAATQAQAMKEIISLVQSGDKIEAIKKFRQLTNVGLKEAKEVIDGLESSMQAPPSVSAETFQESPQVIATPGSQSPSNYGLGSPVVETVSPFNGCALIVGLLVLGVALLVGSWFALPEFRELIMSFLK